MDELKCPKCGKKFSAPEALEQHRNAKHSVDAAQKTKRKLPTKYIIGAIAVIIIISLIYAFALRAPAYTPMTADADNVLGAESAPVTITEYSDFQCPFCGQFYSNTESQIIAEYVDTGKVKIIYKHFPLTQIHQYAQKSAEASECAADQGKFWEYHNKLFENPNALFLSSLKTYASDIGLNRTAFDACLDSGAMTSRVKADLEDGQRRGIRSTPSFFINEVKIEGAQSFASFKQVIDSKLPPQ